MLLTVGDVHATYGRFDVLRGISVGVAAGEIVAVLGPNGAGKSTLLKAIAGFLPPRQGSIRLSDEEIAGLRPSALLRKGVVYVMQRSSVFPKLTILENLRKAPASRAAGDVEAELRAIRSARRTGGRRSTR